jgi:hypothetical protein
MRTRSTRRATAALGRADTNRACSRTTRASSGLVHRAAFVEDQGPATEVRAARARRVRAAS